MSLQVRKMRGTNLYARDNVRARWYPDPTAPAAWVEVWAIDTDKPVTFEHAKLVGRFSPGQQNIVLEFNPATDRYKELRAVTYSAAGVPNVRYLDDAPAVTVLFNRLTDACTLTQVGDSTETIAQVAITDFEPTLVKARHIQRAADSGFTTSLVESTATEQAAKSTSIYISGTTSEVKYVRVRHSSTGASGPWSAWSNTLEIIFDDGAGGGSGGSGDPWGGGIYA